MNTFRFATATLTAVTAAALLVLAPGARAAEPGACEHPALTRGAPCAAAAGIDANTFLVQPPASTRWVVRPVRTNGEHPAVLVARRWHPGAVDANTFLVQPPVAVQWTVPSTDTQLAASGAASLR